VKSSQPDLLCFLYVLLRDYMTFGQIEEIMKNHVELSKGAPREYSQDHMAVYAQSLVDRLVK